MPAISFSTMKDYVKRDKKKQTIRLKRSSYWLRWEEGDRLVGYWKMRSSGSTEKLFESRFREDPFIITPDEWTKELAHKDGFRAYDVWSELDLMEDWFEDKYGKEYRDMEFVVIRWK